MKKHKIISILLMASAFFQLSAQNRITQTLNEFSSLSVSGRVTVELVPSDSHDMSITARKGNPEEVEFEIRNDELKIKTKPDLKKETQIFVKLPYKELTSISALSGAVINSGKELKADHLDLKAMTGGKIELSIEAKTIKAKVIQGSDIILYGKVETQNVVANTGGNYLAYELECVDTYAKSSAGSQVKVTASRMIDASAHSKGFLGYAGDPETTYFKTTLGGEIASYKDKPEDRP